MASIKDVATRAGVSVTTVSLVLNNKGNISKQTRERVLEAVRDLEYTRSIRARNLRDQQSRVIGYAQFKERGEYNPLLDRFLWELVQIVEEIGRHVLLFNTDNNDLVGPYRELIESQRVDGFVLSYTERDDPRFAYLHQAGFPFVAFGRSDTPLDDLTYWVDVDGHAGTQQATCHLIELGHRRIGFIGWPEGSASGDRRYQGYVDVLEQNSIGMEPAYVLRAQNHSQHGCDCAQELLSLQNPPTAIVCVSDILATGAMQYCSRIGQRIAITGFDDTPTAAFMYPALTSVRQPTEAAAKILVDMLLDQFNGMNIKPKQQLLAPQLIVRSSSTLDY
jgi:DNA-binding LacI/PurR family transcriptional regulator